MTSHRWPLPPPPNSPRGHHRRSAVIDVGTFGTELVSRAIPLASPLPIRTPESATAAAHDRALALRAELLLEESEAGGNRQERKDHMGNESGNDQAELKDSFMLNQRWKAKPGNSRKRVTWSDPLTNIYSTETPIENSAYSDQDESVWTEHEDGEGGPSDECQCASFQS